MASKGHTGNIKQLSKSRTKIVKPKNQKRSQKKNKKKSSSSRRKKGKSLRKKFKKGKKSGKKSSPNDTDNISDKKDSIQPDKDPYLQLKETDPSILIRMFLHKLVSHPAINKYLGDFGGQLSSSMLNFCRDFIIPILMSPANIGKFNTIINDRRLIYLLRQSFIKWLIVHRGQMKLVFKLQGDVKGKLYKYNYIITKNHIIQKLSKSVNNNHGKYNNNIKYILNKLPLNVKLKYYHYLKSDIKNPFLAQLTTQIPNNLLPNIKSGVPSLQQQQQPTQMNGNDNNDKKDDSKQVPNDDDKKDDKKQDDQYKFAIQDNDDKEYDNYQIQMKLNGMFDGYKDCVLLSEKQILCDSLKTQYKLLQNAIDDYGKTRWMDAPIDNGHIRLIQREAIHDSEEIARKRRVIEDNYRKKLEKNVNEIHKMMLELNSRNTYVKIIKNKCYKFLVEKLSQIHEEIQRKREAIHLHEKKRENYLNHAAESLKNEQNMRKGVKLITATYHKYLRELTKCKLEYSEYDRLLLDEQKYYQWFEILNKERNQNDKYWFWYKKEKEIYNKSKSSFRLLNSFFKKIEKYLLNEYGDQSDELIQFKKEYYINILSKYQNINLNDKYNQEISKKVTDFEMIYLQKEKSVQFPTINQSIVNRLYKNIGNGESEIIKLKHNRKSTKEIINLTAAVIKSDLDDNKQQNQINNDQTQTTNDDDGDNDNEPVDTDQDSDTDDDDVDNYDKPIQRTYTQTADNEIFPTNIETTTNGNNTNVIANGNDNNTVDGNSIVGNTIDGTNDDDNDDNVDIPPPPLTPAQVAPPPPPPPLPPQAADQTQPALDNMMSTALDNNDNTFGDYHQDSTQFQQDDNDDDDDDDEDRPGSTVIRDDSPVFFPPNTVGDDDTDSDDTYDDTDDDTDDGNGGDDDNTNVYNDDNNTLDVNTNDVNDDNTTNDYNDDNSIVIKDEYDDNKDNYDIIADNNNDNDSPTPSLSSSSSNNIEGPHVTTNTAALNFLTKEPSFSNDPLQSSKPSISFDVDDNNDNDDNDDNNGDYEPAVESSLFMTNVDGDAKSVPAGPHIEKHFSQKKLTLKDYSVDDDDDGDDDDDYDDYDDDDDDDNNNAFGTINNDNNDNNNDQQQFNNDYYDDDDDDDNNNAFGAMNSDTDDDDDGDNIF